MKSYNIEFMRIYQEMTKRDILSQSILVIMKMACMPIAIIARLLQYSVMIVMLVLSIVYRITDYISEYIFK